MTAADAPPFDLVIFDLDGTLVDSLPDIARALNATLADGGQSALPLETVAQFVGDGAGKLIERAFPPSIVADKEQHARVLARFMATYAKAVCVDSRLYPGVLDLLAGLRHRRVATAVLTNKPGNLARALLTALAVADSFMAIIGDGDGFPRKPDVTAARALMSRAGGADASRTAIVGDGLPDMRMARALGCTGIAAGWGYVPMPLLQAENATFVAPSVSDAAARLLSPSDSRAPI